MRHLMAVALTLVCAVALSSCALLPFFQSDNAQADAQMERVAAALDNGDREALTALFSTTALREATDLDERLDHLLSLFPQGDLTWTRNTSVGAESENDYEAKTELLYAFYKVTADGKDYRLFFADFTVNDLVDPDNVGIYALGVIPWTDDVHSDVAEPFFIWANSIHIRQNGPAAYPGIYMPAPQ
ncbi:MAG TPA: DUF5104 domain-containing protein [Pseudolysinimonas sp.]|jgi:hypothetical protein|nr:DUF5104 domain-containing protein [Pseudolysinimonas sp.]